MRLFHPAHSWRGSIDFGELKWAALPKHKAPSSLAALAWVGMTVVMRGLRRRSAQAIMGKECCPMRHQNPNSHLPVCWLHFLVCPRRYLAVLPSQARPSLFGSD